MFFDFAKGSIPHGHLNFNEPQTMQLSTYCPLSTKHVLASCFSLWENEEYLAKYSIN